MEAKAKEICLEMMRQRGYTILNETDLIAKKLNGNEIRVYMITTSNKLNIDKIQEVCSSMSKICINDCIIIYKNSITPAAKEIISNLTFVIECFLYDELQFNITKHYLQPKFELVSNEEESRDLKTKFGNKLPILLHTDPISRFYNYAKGDIIQITRSNDYITYRIVR